MPNKVSKKLIDFIIEKEVSSKEYYQKALSNAEWPGGASGITIGIGYDLGYNSPENIERDWADKLPRPIINNIKKYSGIRGDKARSYISAAKKEITVPWDAAYSVFTEKNIPYYSDLVRKAVPNTDKLSDDCFGVLVSLAYNRGPYGFNIAGDKYREMRDICTHMKNSEFNKIPNEFRSMKRLWDPNKLAGLIKRREEEAKLFEQGLTL